MDHLFKENINSQSGVSAKRKNANIDGFDNLKKLKTVVKPLSDLKNIIGDKINTQHQKIRKEVSAENSVLLSDVNEDNCYELFYSPEKEDNYEDIIPISWQLGEDDIKKLCAVFEPIQPRDVEVTSMEFLPMFDLTISHEDSIPDALCDIIKGIDSTSLFEDIEFRS